MVKSEFFVMTDTGDVLRFLLTLLSKYPYACILEKVILNRRNNRLGSMSQIK
jgi:hypothetical protein